MTAAQAIAESVATNRIVHLPYDADVAVDLFLASEASTEGDTEAEYWGTDDSGQSWRIHMVLS